MAKQLLFSMLCTIVLNSHQPLLAHDNNETKNRQINMQVLATHICNLLLEGHSPDEIIALSHNNQKHTDTIQVLIKQIYELLKEGFSQEKIITIVINNEESEKFYAQKNFESKIKTYWFITKLVVSTLVILSICYLLFKYFSGDGNHHENPQQNTPQNDNSREQQLNTTREPNSEIDENPVNLPHVTHEQASESNQNNAAQTIQERHRTSIETGFAEPRTRNYKVMDFPAHPDLDLTLRDAIAQTIEHARNNGLVPTAITFNDEEFANRRPRDNRLFDELINQQIERARNIGLVSIV